MIKVIAKNFIKEDKVNNALELAKMLVEETSREDGCITYELYQDEKNPRIIIIVEEWEKMEYLNNHMASEHFKKIVPQMNEFMDQKAEINICKKVI